jgi:hypothetical protein
MSWSRTEKPDSVHNFVGRLTGSNARQRSALWGRLGLVLAATAVAAGTWGWFHFNDEKALAETSKAFMDALKTGNASASTAILASSEAGATLLAKDIVRVQAKAQADPKADKHEMTPTLDQIHDTLAKDGVDWSNVQPLAFGGVRAQVADPATMKTYATVVNGELYFGSGAGVFAVEFTSRKCGSMFVITDIWQYHALDVTKEKLAEYSNKRFREFADEQEDPKDTVKLRSPKHIFVVF